MIKKDFGRLLSLKDDVKAVAGQGGKMWMYALYFLLMVLFELVEQPKEKELRSDIYVLF